MNNGLAQHWQLDPAVDFLNHGSFGACPRPVLEVQRELRDEIERQPVEFLARGLPGRIDAARERLAAYLGADPEGLVAVTNATSGVNAVLRSLSFGPRDELLTTDHEYNACRNALDFVAERSGARVVVARLPFPCEAPERLVEAIVEAVSERTRLVLLDHVTSPTGMIVSIEPLIRALACRGVDCLVDGAHAPGMLPLELNALGSAYYVGNCHKWLCAPKGAAFLWVREDRREQVRPLTISHGANTSRPGRSRFHDEFDWPGTVDPTAFLSVPAAIEFMGSLLPGGWPEIRARNKRLALEARDVLTEALDIRPPCSAEMIGSLVSLPLPDGSPGTATSALYTDPLQDVLLREYGIEVPVIPWPASPRRMLRISVQLYNSLEQYERLAAALQDALSR